MNPRVKQVRAIEDYQLVIVFDNGEKRLYDCRPLLDFGVFRDLSDPICFSGARAALGTVVWPGEQDICPDTLYQDSEPIMD